MREHDRGSGARLSAPSSDEEAVQRHLSLARAQGDAYDDALADFASAERVEVIERRVDDYRISCLVCEPAALEDDVGTPTRSGEPDAGDVRLCVFVRDAGDGRFVPSLRVTATLVDAGGACHGTHEQPLTWHPVLYHYARNWRLAGPAPHQFRVVVEPPTFTRYGSGPSPRFDRRVELEVAATRESPASDAERGPVGGQ